MAWGEREAWLRGSERASYDQRQLAEAQARPGLDRQRRKLLKARDLPWENSPQGLLKHLVNEEMDARCETVDAYMQIIPPGSRSGRRRQLAEQAVYVLEGRGYDVHVDCDLEIVDHGHTWKPQEQEKHFEWEADDVVYIPPNTIAQHHNADPRRSARIIVVTSRIYRYSGLNDVEQLETAPEYDPSEILNADILESYLAQTSARESV